MTDDDRIKESLRADVERLTKACAKWKGIARIFLNQRDVANENWNDAVGRLGVAEIRAEAAEAEVERLRPMLDVNQRLGDKARAERDEALARLARVTLDRDLLASARDEVEAQVARLMRAAALREGALQICEAAYDDALNVLRDLVNNSGMMGMESELIMRLMVVKAHWDRAIALVKESK
jgi:hypothetical protein